MNGIFLNQVGSIVWQKTWPGEYNMRVLRLPQSIGKYIIHLFELQKAVEYVFRLNETTLMTQRGTFMNTKNMFSD